MRPLILQTVKVLVVLQILLRALNCFLFPECLFSIYDCLVDFSLIIKNPI